jgi:hypothetical protein
MVEAALRGVVREVLTRTAANGLPGAHHFYITFQTRHPGVELPESLLAQYPEEMTIVLEHQFWDLEVTGDGFSVTLSFQNRPERLIIPLEAVTAFADPAVKFGLQFQAVLSDAVEQGEPEPARIEPAKPDAAKPAEKGDKPGEVVTLDAFRKK